MISLARMLLLAIVAAFLAVAGRDPNAPRFRNVTEFALPAYTALDYNFLAQRPFEGGQAWLRLINGTNGSVSFLFDLERRQVAGELSNARAVYSNQDRSKLLCVGEGPACRSVTDRLKAAASLVLRQGGVAPPKFLQRASADSSLRIESFWILDLKSNRAIFLGDISQQRAAGTSFHPSPNFRFGFNKPSTAGSTDLIFLCDLEENRMRELHVEGWPVGWWDDRRIVMSARHDDFLLFDVVTGISSPLLSARDIAAFLDERRIPHENQRPGPFFAWNGREDEFYLTDTSRKWRAANSFLLKVSRPDARLSVVKPSFKFEWSDHFDPSQQYYVYTGLVSGQRSDGVFLRDLRTGAQTTLVEPRGKRYFSLPHFYKDSVLYIHANALWRVGLDGRGNTRLFP